MEVRVPDLGDFDEVEVIEILVKPGDKVSAEDPLLTLETEKAAMDVPSPSAGIVKEISVAVGGKVSAGDPVLILETESAGDADEAASGESASADADEPDADEPGADEPDAESGADEADAPPATGDAPAPGEQVTITVPDIGDFSDVEIIEVLVAEGDSVDAEQGLLTLETEKAAMDVPAPSAGKIVELLVRVGDRVNAGDRVAVVESAGDEAAAKSPSAKSGKSASAAPSNNSAAGAVTGGRAAAKPQPSPASARRIDEAGFSRAHASPSVRKLARELGVDLARVNGSGRKSRVTSGDVKAFVKAAMLGGGTGPALPEVPTVDFAKFGPVETQALSRIQKISGPRLHASWVNVPHVTQHDEADISEMEETRQSLKAAAAERDIKLTPLAFVIRACALTLAEFPAFTSSLSPDGASLVMKSYMHIGFAADTPNGLVVPVIRDADKKDVYELASALTDLSTRARDGKLKADDMQGGVFTVSSLGGIGGTYFTPIINAPEVAILGVSRHSMKPVYQDGGFVPRLMLPLSLSYDHRVIDGAMAARFITHLSDVLGQAERLVEAIP